MYKANLGLCKCKLKFMQLETYSEKAIKDMGLKGPSQGIHFNFTLYMMILFMIFNVIQITKGEKEKDRNNIVKDSIRQGIIIFYMPNSALI